MSQRKLARSRLKRKLNKGGFVLLFLAPAMIAFALFYLYPLVNIFVTSFCKWDYTNIRKPEFWGWKNMFKNYEYIFKTYPFFWEAVRNSFAWALLGIFFHIPLAFIMALAFSRKMKGVKIVQIIFIIPCVISAAALTMTFQQLFSPSFGFVNQIIKIFNPDFKGNILLMEGPAFWAITATYIFYTGTSTLVILGNIKGIAPEVREAALMDGASGFKQDFCIVLPMLTNTLKTLAILSGISGFIIYNQIYFMTQGACGTYSLSYVIRELAVNSPRAQFGRANVVAIVLIVGGLLVVGIINLTFKIPDLISKLRRKPWNA